MSDTIYVFGTILLMALVTLVLRALPFVAARWLRRNPLVHKLGDSLPLAIMSLLLIDALAGHARSHPGLPWQELVAVLLVIVIQVRTRQTLLSILLGTMLYVGLRNPWLG